MCLYESFPGKGLGESRNPYCSATLKRLEMGGCASAPSPLPALSLAQEVRCSLRITGPLCFSSSSFNEQKKNECNSFPPPNKSLCFLYGLHVASEAAQARLPILPANVSAPFIFHSEQEPFPETCSFHRGEIEGTGSLASCFIVVVYKGHELIDFLRYIL